MYDYFERRLREIVSLGELGAVSAEILQVFRQRDCSNAEIAFVLLLFRNLLEEWYARTPGGQ